MLRHAPRHPGEASPGQRGTAPPRRARALGPRHEDAVVALVLAAVAIPAANRDRGRGAEATITQPAAIGDAP
jgi:hypothetical protein